MAEADHSKEAVTLGKLAMRSGYVNDAYPQKVATLAEMHALLAVAEAISELTGVIADRFSA